MTVWRSPGHTRGNHVSGSACSSRAWDVIMSALPFVVCGVSFVTNDQDFGPETRKLAVIGSLYRMLLDAEIVNVVHVLCRAGAFGCVGPRSGVHHCDRDGMLRFNLNLHVAAPGTWIIGAGGVVVGRVESHRLSIDRKLI